jgi:putative ABC transport system permease protein
MFSLALALALSEVLQPPLDRFLNASIDFQYLRDWPILLFVIGISIIIGLLSGAYPALVLSNIRPGRILRNSSNRQAGSGLLRTSLVVLQFAVSIGLGIAVLVVFAQISFARHVNLGFHKDDVLVIDVNDMTASGRDSFSKALGANPDIADVALTDAFAIPFAGNNNNIDVNVPGTSSTFTFWVVTASPNYAQVYGLQLLSGRLLSESRSADTVTDMHLSDNNFSSAPYNILINETASRMLGYSPASAVGKTVSAHGTSATIVGVVADIKMDGAHKFVRPTLYRYIPAFTGQISVRLRGQHLSRTLAFIDRTWHAFVPGAVIHRHFLNDDFETLFLADERQGTIFSLFVGFAIFIACLGLFGLAAFSTERRIAEIGIRKTFGARTRDIILLLLWQFSIPVLIANVIAWPVAYYYLHQWLEGYAYRVNLNPLYFIGAGFAALVIAGATVIVHAVHVARANPIHALRYE